MKHVVVLFVVSLVGLGCAATSQPASFVGHWQAIDLPKDKVPSNVASEHLVLTADRQAELYMADGKGAPVRKALTGSWDLNGKNGIRLTFDFDGENSVSTAKLRNPSTLIVNANGESMTMTRDSQNLVPAPK